MRHGATSITPLHVPRDSIADVERRAPHTELTEATIGRDHPDTAPRRRARLIDAARQERRPAATTEDDATSHVNRRGFPPEAAEAMARRWGG